MGRRFRASDPTARDALANVTRENKYADRKIGKSRGRRILDEFPDIFNGLLPHEAREVALRAHQIAGNDVWAIERHHLEEARRTARKAARKADS